MEENKKKKLFMIGMSVLLILVLVIGGTYAWFTLQLNGTKVNVLKAGSLSLILNDENSVGINSDKAVPMLDEVGETLDPYHFTLENHSDIASEYTIYLDDIDLETDEVRMNDSFVKYQLTKDGTKTTAKLNTIGEHPNRVLDTGTINGNQTITYDLRLWIDENTGNEAMGQVVKTKIRVVATQSANITMAPNENILNVYSYSIEEETKCITGEEATCVELTERPDTYAPGTIIKYKVNDTEEKYFHVISENENTLTIQERENTINNVKWYDTGSSMGSNSKGPLTVLPTLENATAGWTNVNDQTYTMSVTTFNTNSSTSYNDRLKEAGNIYTLPERTGKARMITVQEAMALGCTKEDQSCPVWMYNYIAGVTNYGGTAIGPDSGYWTMTANSPASEYAMAIHYPGDINVYMKVNTSNIGARAVVVIDK